MTLKWSETMQGTKARQVQSLKGIRPVGKPRSVGDAVYDALKVAITRGDLLPGQRLIEHQLSLQMRTSRIPIREAIKKLEKDGLVERPHKRGFVVKSVTKAEIEETFGIRAVLESYAAYLATERLTDTLMRRLEKTVQAYREALAKNDVEKMMTANGQFHETIYKASGSEKLYTLINNFRDYISRFRKTLLVTKDFAKISLDDHVQMLDAMKEGDKEKVEELVRKHILRGKEIIIREMEAGRLI
jgi:DNA-binding GntR family transcriptional regulator